MLRMVLVLFFIYPLSFEVGITGSEQSSAIGNSGQNKAFSVSQDVLSIYSTSSTSEKLWPR